METTEATVQNGAALAQPASSTSVKDPLTYADVEEKRKRLGLQAAVCAKAAGIPPAIWTLLEKGGDLPSAEKMLEGVKKAKAARDSEVLL